MNTLSKKLFLCISSIFDSDVLYKNFTQEQARIDKDIQTKSELLDSLREEKRVKLNEKSQKRKKLAEHTSNEEENVHRVARQTLESHKEGLKKENIDHQIQIVQLKADIANLEKPLSFDTIPTHEYDKDHQILVGINKKIESLQKDSADKEASNNNFQAKLEESLGSTNVTFRRAFSQAFTSLSKATSTYKMAGFQWQKAMNVIGKVQAQLGDHFAKADPKDIKEWANQLVASAQKCNELLEDRYLLDIT